MFIPRRITLRQFIVSLLIFLQFTFPISPVLANPYFYLAGNSVINVYTDQYYEVRLNTDNMRVGALQTILTFDSQYFFFEPKDIYITGTICDMYTYPNPGTVGVENKVTPYVTGGNKLVITCGIMDTGYLGYNGMVVRFKLVGDQLGEAQFNFSQNYFSYLGTSIAPGAMSTYYVNLVNEASVTPTPTPDHLATYSASPTPIVSFINLFDDVKFLDVSQQFASLNEFAKAYTAAFSGSSQGSSLTTGSSGLSLVDDDLEVVEEDNLIPAPPADIVLRERATPYPAPEIQFQEGLKPGQVMSMQSLRDLLIPGKSDADKTVVMINLISTIIFLLILIYFLIRMFINRRNAKVKSQYISELISGELSALGTKIDVVKEQKGKEKFEQEFKETVESILTNVDQAQSKVKNK